MFAARTQPPRITELGKASRQNVTRANSTNERKLLATKNFQFGLTKRAFPLLAIVFVAMLLQPGSAQAGTGTFRDGKFNFCASVRFNATEAQLTRIREVLEIASQQLGDATDGQ